MMKDAGHALDEVILHSHHEQAIAGIAGPH
jgi:hypothetical protein